MRVLCVGIGMDLRKSRVIRVLFQKPQHSIQFRTANSLSPASVSLRKYVEQIRSNVFSAYLHLHPL